MKFEHEPFVFEKLKRITDEKTGKRIYEVPSGEKYASVTTMLQLLSEKNIKAWKERVGEKEAKAVAKKATTRGKSIHKLTEDYLLNKSINKELLNPFHVPLFNDIKRILDNNITKVHNLEFFIYSHKYRYAGQSDIFAEWNYKKAIIDIKTSKKQKIESWCEPHFLQETMYAMAVYELHGVLIPKIVTIIAIDSDLPQVLEKDTKDYIKKVLNFIRLYRTKYPYEDNH